MVVVSAWDQLRDKKIRDGSFMEEIQVHWIRCATELTHEKRVQ